MSLGPSKAPRAVPETHLSRARATIAQVIHLFKDDTAMRLFYCGVAFLLLGLPLGLMFPPMYYVTLGMLGCILLSQYVLTQHNSNKHDK